MKRQVFVTREAGELAKIPPVMFGNARSGVLATFVAYAEIRAEIINVLVLTAPCLHKAGQIVAHAAPFGSSLDL
jgi:hypothetical protein